MRAGAVGLALGRPGRVGGGRLHSVAWLLAGDFDPLYGFMVAAGLRSLIRSDSSREFLQGQGQPESPWASTGAWGRSGLATPMLQVESTEA